MGLLGDAFNIAGSIIGGSKKKKASKKAVAALETAGNQAIGTLTNATNEVVPTFQPYQEAGTQSLAQIVAGLQSGEFNAPDPSTIGADMSLLDGPVAPDASQFQASPDYQYRLDQSLKGVQATAAGRYGLNSGVTLKALADRAGQEASAEFGNWWDRTRQSGLDAYGANVAKYNAQYGQSTDRYNAAAQSAGQRYGRLGDLVNLGYGATGDVARTKLGLAGNVGDIQMDIGNAKAGGIIQRGNINAQNWQNIGSFMGNAAEGIASGGLSEIGRQFGIGGSSYGTPAAPPAGAVPGYGGGWFLGNRRVG